MPKITITIWDENDDLAVAAVDFDPPISDDKPLSQAQKVAQVCIASIDNPGAIPGSKIEGVWTDNKGWLDDSD